jgi:uncharacterized protein
LRLTNRTMTNSEINDVLRSAKVGRLGLYDVGYPYVVPVNFAFETGHIYFHSADVGTKMGLMKENPSVCFEVDQYIRTIEASSLCGYDTAYRSVIAFGKARILEDAEEKAKALRLIVSKYARPEEARKLETRIVEAHRSSHGSRTIVVDILIQQMTGKHHVPEGAVLGTLAKEAARA